MHDPAWEENWVEDDRPDWARNPEMQKCIGAEDYLGRRIHCYGAAIGPAGLCAKCDADDGWTVEVCRYCGLNSSSYVRPPTCRTCYQWLRRNRAKYDDEELFEQLARVVARRRRKVGRREALDD